MRRVSDGLGPAPDAAGAVAALAARRPLVVDVAIAVGLTLLSVLTVVAGAGDIGAVSGVALILLLLETLPLALRRVWPVPVWIVTLGATAGHFLVSTGAPSTIRATLGALIALFTVSERYERRQSIWALLVTGVLIGGINVFRTGFPAGLGGLVQITVAVTVPWVLGTWSRERQSYAALAEARALAAERHRDEEALRAVAEERERIARELHDVVAHNLSVIVIQAGAGLRAFGEHPDQSRGTLVAIDTTAREALGEMRRMLSLLQPAEGAAELSPLPGLGNLGALLERVRSAGVGVDLAVDGEPYPVSPALGLSAYRIVQEALTNTLRHSGARRAHVRLRYRSTGVEVEVTDDGAGQVAEDEKVETPHAGRGLIGMRERVALFGGELEAGPRPSGGYRVLARIPTADASTDG
jgi:signal transduction histidine kinase